METKYITTKIAQTAGQTTILDQNMVESEDNIADNAARIEIMNISRRILGGEEIPIGATFDLQLAVNGHTSLRLAEVWRFDYPALINGARSEIKTIGHRVKLGNVIKGEFYPSVYSYVMLPPCSQRIDKVEA